MFGSLLLQSNGAFNYVPATEFVGTDHINYRAVASPSASDLTTVEIQVRDTNEAPVALSDFYQMSKNQTLSVQKDDGVLSNDFDFDGDSLRLLSFGSPANGAVESVARGGFVYSPDVGFVGVDSFSYEITDGIDVATGSVSMQVVNDAPN